MSYNIKNLTADQQSIIHIHMNRLVWAGQRRGDLLRKVEEADVEVGEARENVMRCLDQHVDASAAPGGGEGDDA